MSRITKYSSIKKDTLETEFGCVTVNSVEIDDEKMEELITNFVLEDENLKYMFCDANFAENKTRDLLRFIPPITPPSINKFVTKSCVDNHNFYSFLAEGLMGLVFRDLMGYELGAALIDANETLNDTHSGVDGCLYDDEKEIIVLGEAKFYKKLYDGFTEIISNFTKDDSFFNKLSSLFIKARNNKNAVKIILRKLGYEDIKELDLQQFLSIDFVFCGFVLHELSTTKKEKFKDGTAYKSLSISSNNIIDNMKRLIDSLDISDKEYNIYMYHLPVKSKEELIIRVISKAYELLEEGRVK